MKAYHDQATAHYLRSSQMFYNNLVHSSALMLCSKTDPIGSMSSNLRVKQAWESLGIQVSPPVKTIWARYERSYCILDW